MGRKPLSADDVTVKTTLRFPRGLLARIEAVAGENRVAAFIREAVEEAITSAEGRARRSKPPKGVKTEGLDP